MHVLFIISVGIFFAMFILFLVISHTLNNVVNHLAKIEFILTKEYQYSSEAQVIKKIFNETEEGSGE